MMGVGCSRVPGSVCSGRPAGPMPTMSDSLSCATVTDSNASASITRGNCGCCRVNQKSASPSSSATVAAATLLITTRTGAVIPCSFSRDSRIGSMPASRPSATASVTGVSRSPSSEAHSCRTATKAERRFAASGRKRLPMSVRANGWASRSTRWPPTHCSSDWIRRDKPDCDVLRCRAARVKLRHSTTARKSSSHLTSMKGSFLHPFGSCRSSRQLRRHADGTPTYGRGRWP